MATRILRWTLCLLLAGAVLSARAEDISAEDLAAEEAAAAAVGKQAELEADEDVLGALDEEADAARATIADPNKHPLTDMMPPSGDVDVGTVIPGLGDDGRLLVGREYSALVAFANGGRTRLHLWGMMGSLNYDDRWDVYVQNFTYQIVNRTVESGEEMSLNYRFTPNERLDTRKFQLALSVFYEARNSAGEVLRSHASTFFNRTIDAAASPRSVGGGSIGILILITIVAGAGGIYGYKLARSTARRPVEVGTTTTKPDRTEWLAEHQSMVGARSRARSQSPSRDRKSNEGRRGRKGKEE